MLRELTRVRRRAMDFHNISITILPRNYPKLLSLEPSEMLCETHNIDIKSPSESALLR